jgi:hypothetical protein
MKKMLWSITWSKISEDAREQINNFAMSMKVRHMDEYLNQIDQLVREFADATQLLPVSGRSKVIRIMTQAILDRTYQIRIELDSIRRKDDV